MSKNNFGGFIQKARIDKNLSLRAVERKTGISNAYLSQLESNKIKQPSPNILHKLSNLYEVSYSHLLSLVGYPVPENPKNLNVHSRLGNITTEEEDALLEYLEFLRSKKR